MGPPARKAWRLPWMLRRGPRPQSIWACSKGRPMAVHQALQFPARMPGQALVVHQQMRSPVEEIVGAEIAVGVVVTDLGQVLRGCARSHCARSCAPAQGAPQQVDRHDLKAAVELRALEQIPQTGQALGGIHDRAAAAHGRHAPIQGPVVAVVHPGVHALEPQVLEAQAGAGDQMVLHLPPPGTLQGIEAVAAAEPAAAVRGGEHLDLPHAGGAEWPLSSRSSRVESAVAAAGDVQHPQGRGFEGRRRRQGQGRALAGFRLVLEALQGRHQPGAEAMALHLLLEDQAHQGEEGLQAPILQPQSLQGRRHLPREAGVVFPGLGLLVAGILGMAHHRRQARPDPLDVVRIAAQPGLEPGRRQAAQQIAHDPVRDGRIDPIEVDGLGQGRRPARHEENAAKLPTCTCRRPSTV